MVPELRLVCDLHLHLKGPKAEVLEWGNQGDTKIHTKKHERNRNTQVMYMKRYRISKAQPDSNEEL